MRKNGGREDGRSVGVRKFGAGVRKVCRVVSDDDDELVYRENVRVTKMSDGTRLKTALVSGFKSVGNGCMRATKKRRINFRVF